MLHNAAYNLGSTLSHFAFILDIDELIYFIQDEILWCMLFTNDVLIDESSEDLNQKFELGETHNEGRILDLVIVGLNICIAIS